MDLIELILLLICIFLTLAGGLAIVIVLKSKHYPVIMTYAKEKTFLNPENGSLEPFPSINDASSKSLSVVVPAYNEEERLPIMLEECMEYLSERARQDKAFSYEVIIVDDGSKDTTTKVGHKWSARFGSDKVRVLSLEKNRGKGGAVRMGVLRARGEYVLFVDADGATKFEDLDKMEAEMRKVERDGLAVVCGSRAHLEKDSIAQRSLFRTVLMYGFHACVHFFGAKTIKDTQCGFKLLTRESARTCFGSLHIERWAFDVELLKIAEMLDMPLGEVAVRWTEVDGSKLNPVLASLQMFRDLFLLWVRYALGAWRVRVPKKRD